MDVTWLSHEPWTTLFLLLGAVSLIPALITVGTGLGETVTLLSFVCFFLGRWQLHPDVLAPLLFFLGVTFVWAEIWVVPGLGKAGSLGAVLMGIGLVRCYPDLSSALPALGEAGVSLLLGLGFALRFLRSHIGLRNALPPPAARPAAAAHPLLGARGFAVTALSPSGHAEIEGTRCDVRCAGGYLASGCELEVIGQDGGQLLVRPVGSKL